LYNIKNGFRFQFKIRTATILNEISTCTPSFIDLKPKESNQFPLILVNLFLGLEVLDTISNNVA
jgi:hypothetical protein